MGAHTPPAVVSATAGGVAYEDELEIQPTRIHDVEAWLPSHIAELLTLPGFLSVESLRGGTTADGWVRHKNVYRLASREALARYLHETAPEMTTRLRASFGDDVRATRRVFEPAPLASRSVTARRAVACLNCGASLSGKYCGACGQRHDPHIHSVWHFMREAAENLTHADSRVWRTLWALLARPGELTREFLDGRRMRHLPPFRLYLVISIAVFLLASALSRDAALEIKLPRDDAARAEAEARQIPAAKTVPSAPPQAAPHATPEQRAERICKPLSSNVSVQPWIQQRLYAGCSKTVRDQGKALKSEFMNNLPRAMFVLLPLLALLMCLVYWRPRRYYVEHLLFFIHAHTAAFIAIGVMILINSIAVLDPIAGFVNFGLVAYLAWYLYKSMRRVYGQGRLPTLLKYGFISVCYVVLAATVVLATMVYSLTAL